MGIVESDVLHLPIKYIIQLYVDNIDIRFDLQVDVVEVQFFLLKFRSVALSPSRVTYQGRYRRIVNYLSDRGRHSETYPEYAQSPGHTRLHNIKVLARRMCPELRANI